MRAAKATAHSTDPEGAGTIAEAVFEILGRPEPVRVASYDGGRAGAPRARATLRIERPEAIAHLLWAPGELGLARAYVSGALDLDGDPFACLDLGPSTADRALRLRALARLLRLTGWPALRRPSKPPEEVRLGGLLHSRKRDRAAISHHYDVSNEFYRLVLGPSMTYSCAVFADDQTPLEAAQAAKYDLIAGKLGLAPGMRLLDLGCGWGGMVQRAAKGYGTRAVGVTISDRQLEWTRRQIAADGLDDRVELRHQDYRDIDDGPYDAISSIGMFEHVGTAKMRGYLRRLYRLLRPGGRLLNHGVVCRWQTEPSPKPGGFMQRYAFPDLQLCEVGSFISLLQEVGFEVRHVENLREHYVQTMRCWLANLDAHWERAVELIGEPRARIWRLFIAGGVVSFGWGSVQLQQVLAVRPRDDGGTGMPWRPTW